MRKSMPLLFIAALSVLLSACFTSEGPKFPVSSAIPALGDGGRFVVFEQSGGKYDNRRPMTIKKLPDGSYEFVGEKATLLQASFHDIGGGLIVAQVKPNPNKNAYGYLFLTQKGDERFLHPPQCDQQDAAVLAANGVIKRDKFECSIDKVADPAKLFAALNIGAPSTKIVPE
jgi:hypothetical protein